MNLNSGVDSFLRSKNLKLEAAPHFAHTGPMGSAAISTFVSACDSMGPNVTFYITQSSKVFAAYLSDWAFDPPPAPLAWKPDAKGKAVLFTDAGQACPQGPKPGAWVHSNKFPSIFGLSVKGPTLEVRSASTFPSFPFGAPQTFTLDRIEVYKVIPATGPAVPPPPLPPPETYSLQTRDASGQLPAPGMPCVAWARWHSGVVELFDSQDSTAITNVFDTFQKNETALTARRAVLSPLPAGGLVDMKSLEWWASSKWRPQSLLDPGSPIFRIVAMEPDIGDPTRVKLIVDATISHWELLDPLPGHPVVAAVAVDAASMEAAFVASRPHVLQNLRVSTADVRGRTYWHMNTFTVAFFGCSLTRLGITTLSGGKSLPTGLSLGRVCRQPQMHSSCYDPEVESSDDDESDMQRQSTDLGDDPSIDGEAADAIDAWNSPLDPRLAADVTKATTLLVAGQWLAALQLLEAPESTANGLCPLKADVWLLALADGQLLADAPDALLAQATRLTRRAIAALSQGRGQTFLLPRLRRLLLPGGPPVAVAGSPAAAPPHRIHSAPLRQLLSARLGPQPTSLHARWLLELKGVAPAASPVAAMPPAVRPVASKVPQPKPLQPPTAAGGGTPRALAALWAYEGMDHVLRHVATLVEARRVVNVQGAKLPVGHFQFLGNPGTGKTAMAALFGQLLVEEGFLPAGATYVETTGGQLVLDGVKDFQALLAPLTGPQGGVLFLDEVYQLEPKTNPVGRQITDMLMQAMEKHRHTLVVVVAGYKKQVDAFLAFNPGLPSRFSQTIHFLDFDNVTLRNIFLKQLALIQSKHRLDNEATLTVAIERLASLRGTAGFGNARDVRKVVEAACKRQAARLAQRFATGPAVPGELHLITRADVLGEVPAARLRPWPALQELDALVGIPAVKDRVFEDIVAVVRNAERSMNGLAPLAFFYNRCFVGPQGLGKTTVARLYARMLCDLGIVEDPVPVERTPKALLDPAIGQSAKNVVALIEGSVGKVVFLDEAPQINDGTPQGKEMADALVATVEAAPTFRPILITAGYLQATQEMFRTMNAGLARRLNPGDRPIEFTAYTSEEMHLVVRRSVHRQLPDGGSCSRAFADHAVRVLARDAQKPNFGNLGAVEALVSAALQRATARGAAACAGSPVALLPEDVAVPAAEDGRATDEALTRSPALTAWYVKTERVLRRLKRLGQPALPAEHLLFLGPPGTGKSTSARALAALCCRLELIPGTHYTETTPAKMQTGYVGQAALKAREVLESAKGGVLFIDEAYTMTDGYGRQILDEMVAALEEPGFLGKLVVVLGGYEDRVMQMLANNEGAASRFPTVIRFRELSGAACASIFLEKCRSYGIGWDPATLPAAGGAREARIANLCERMIASVAGWASARDVLNFAKFCLHELEEDEAVLTMGQLTTLAEQFMAKRPKQPKAATLLDLLAAGGGHAPAQGAEAPGAGVQQTRLKTKTPEAEAAPPPDAAPTTDSDGSGGGETPDQTVRRYLQALQARLTLLRASGDAADDEYAALLEAEARRLRALDEAAAKKEQAALKIKMALAAMGVCPAGFLWSREGSGWRCGGGSHFMSDEELQKAMK